MWSHQYDMRFGGWSWLGGGGGLLILLALAVLLAALVLWLWPRLQRSRNATTAGRWPKYDAAPFRNRSSSPRETLALRYARGEITRDQFKAMMHDLDEREPFSIR